MKKGDIQFLNHTTSSSAQYILERVYELPIKSESLFRDIFKEIFSLSIVGEVGEDQITYKNFEVEIDKKNIIVEKLVIGLDSLKITVAAETRFGEKMLDLILEKIKEKKAIPKEEKMIKSCRYTTSIKVRSDLKTISLIAKSTQNFFEIYSNELKKLYGENIEFVTHPYLIRAAMVAFSPNSDKKNSEYIFDRFTLSIQIDSFDEYIGGIVLFYSELKFDSHLKLIEKFLESLS